jgi:chromosome segregation ATPase
VVVDHELKRFGGVIMGDLNRILEQVIAVRDRICRLEEDLLQREVESRMQAEQLNSSAALILQLQEQVSQLTRHNTDKDSQMDLLRDQVARRNASLDETRVKFRKEVMRYKGRVYELEMELDTSAGKRGRRMSVADVDDEGSSEMMAIAETAVKETTEKYLEETRQLKVKHAREMKAVITESNMKLAERENEILRLRSKLAVFNVNNSNAPEG